MSAAGTKTERAEIARWGLARKLGHASWMWLMSGVFFAVVVYGITGKPLLSTATGHVLDSLFGWGALSWPVLALAAAAWRTSGAGEVRVEGDSLVWTTADGARRVFARETIREAWVGRADGSSSLEVEFTDGNRFTARVSEEAEAQLLVRALGMDAAHRTHTALLGSRGWSALAGVIAGYAVFMASLAMPFFRAGRLVNAVIPVLSVLAGLLAAYVAFPSELEVGADGLRVTTRGRARFISYGELEGVAQTTGLELKFRDGRTETLRVNWTASLREGLVPRVREGMRVAARGLGESAALVGLDRNGRSFARWSEDLAQLASAVGGFRDAAIGAEQLLSVLRDAAAPAARRVGAAVALVATGGAEAREQVRVVAESSASQPVRVALEGVLEGSLDERGLERLENAERGEQQRRPAGP